MVSITDESIVNFKPSKRKYRPHCNKIPPPEPPDSEVLSFPITTWGPCAPQPCLHEKKGEALLKGSQAPSANT